MLLAFNNFTDSDGVTWTVEGSGAQIVQDPVVGNCLELDGESYLFCDRTDISDFGLGEFKIEYNVKPDPESKGRQLHIYASALYNPEEGINFFDVNINQYGQPAIQTTGRDVHIASGMDMRGIDLFDGAWHKVTCTRDADGLIHWFHNDDETGVGNTWQWGAVDITSAHGSYVSSRYDLMDKPNNFYKGLIDYLEIIKV